MDFWALDASSFAREADPLLRKVIDPSGTTVDTASLEQLEQIVKRSGHHQFTDCQARLLECKELIKKAKALLKKQAKRVETALSRMPSGALRGKLSVLHPEQLVELICQLADDDPSLVPAIEAALPVADMTAHCEELEQLCDAVFKAFPRDKFGSSDQDGFAWGRVKPCLQSFKKVVLDRLAPFVDAKAGFDTLRFIAQAMLSVQWLPTFDQEAHNTVRSSLTRKLVGEARKARKLIGDHQAEALRGSFSKLADGQAKVDFLAALGGDAWAAAMAASGQSSGAGAGKKRGNSCSDPGSSIGPSSGSIEAIDVEDEGEEENEDDQASKRFRLLSSQSSSAGASSFSVSSRRAASCEVIEIDDD